MSQANPVLSIRNLAKAYGARLLFKNASADFYPASLILITGANGCGKTSFLRILAGLAKPTKGHIDRHNDVFPDYLGHRPPAYGQLSALENLAFWAKIRKISASQKDLLNILAQLGLQNSAHERVAVFSRGMLQKLQFGRLLLTRSPLILLDEPHTGLDPSSRAEMRQMLTGWKQDGACVIMVSHDPQGDAELADEVCHFHNRSLQISGNCRPRPEDAPC